MSKKAKIKASDEAWDSGQLGREAEFVRASKTSSSSIDEAVGLQLVSIRLQKSLIEDFKNLAKLNGIGYQPLMRQVLMTFAENEKRRMARNLQRNAVLPVARRANDDDDTEWPDKERIAL